MAQQVAQEEMLARAGTSSIIDDAGRIAIAVGGVGEIANGVKESGNGRLRLAYTVGEKCLKLAGIVCGYRFGPLSPGHTRPARRSFRRPSHPKSSQTLMIVCLCGKLCMRGQAASRACEDFFQEISGKNMDMLPQSTAAFPKSENFLVL
jgi:hypothetical protein